MAEEKRPPFARDFPRDPALDELVEAFVRGNYARVRSGAAGLVSAEDAGVRSAARELVDRTRPDPLATVLLGLAAVLLVIVSVYWAIHGKAPAQQLLPTSPATHPSARSRS